MSKDLSPIQDLGRHSESQNAHQVPRGDGQHGADVNMGNSSFHTALNPVNSSNPMSAGPLSDNARQTHGHGGTTSAPYQKFLSINSSTKKTQKTTKNQKVNDESHIINQPFTDDLRGWVHQD